VRLATRTRSAPGAVECGSYHARDTADWGALGGTAWGVESLTPPQAAIELTWNWELIQR
jgi:hypothetical protein